MTKLRLAVLMLVAIVLLVAVMPVGAITDGELDGDGHPNVVLLLMEIDGEPAYRCSATMLSPHTVLTAGHCTGEGGMGGEFSGMRIFTESDVQGGIGTTNNYPYGGGKYTVEAKAFYTHPEYTSDAFYLHDVGVVILRGKGFDPGVFGVLPTTDQLDSLSTSQKPTFTSVGYGLQQVNGAFSTGMRTRMVAYPKLNQINTGFTGPGSLLLSNNTHTGGTCFGDSGGPNFLGDSSIIAGVTSYGLNGSCGGTGGVFRMDRQDVLDFIAEHYVP